MISRLRVYYFYVSIPVFVLIAGVAFYFNAIEYTVANNPVPQILYAIFLVIVIGIVSIMISMRGLAKEAVMVKNFFRAESGQADKNALMKLTGNGHSSYLLRMIAASTGRAFSSHEFYSLQDELKKVGSRLTGGNVLPQFIAGLLVGMGLLGTFIGLLSAVRDISGMIGELARNEGAAVSALVAFSNLIQHLKAPMQSMGIAFSASLYGLLGSIITSLMMLGLRRFQSDIFSYLSSEVAQHSENCLATAAPARSSEAISSLVMARRNDEDTQILSRIEERLAEMARSEKRLLAAEAEALQKQRADMMQILTLQTGASRDVRSEIQGLGERLESIINVSEKGSREISAQLAELVVSLTVESNDKDTQVLTRIEERMAEMARSQKRLLSVEAEALQKQRADMMNILSAQTEASHKVRGEILGLNERLEGIMKISEKDRHEISAQITELIVHLTSESNGEDKQVLTRIEERMAEMARSQKRLLSVEAEALQKQQSDLIQILTAQTDASHKVGGEIQGLGERLENIMNISEKGNHEISSQITELIVHMSADSKETNRLLQYMLEEQHQTNKLLDGKDQLEQDVQQTIN